MTKRSITAVHFKCIRLYMYLIYGINFKCTKTYLTSTNNNLDSFEFRRFQKPKNQSQLSILNNNIAIFNEKTLSYLHVSIIITTVNMLDK